MPAPLLGIRILIQRLGKRATLKLGASVSAVLTLPRSDKLSRCLRERDSPRDQLVVTIFLLVVFGLLLGAGIKRRLEKAGLDVGSTWNNGVTWWEVCVQPNYGVTSHLFVLVFSI